MLKDITLGQYFPGETVIHRLDPRTKLLLVDRLHRGAVLAPKWVVGYARACSRFWSPSSAFPPFRSSVICQGHEAAAAHHHFDRRSEPVLSPRATVLVHFWIFNITTAGHSERRSSWCCASSCSIAGTFLLTYTTSPIALTDGLESLLKPLKKIKLPVHELAMMMSIALRFIPTLIEETDKIMSAQKARGADFETGNLMQRAKALVPILVPLFISAFRRADELATAMECRCYHGGEGRTRMKQLTLTASRDFSALVLWRCCAGRRASFCGSFGL